MPASFNNVPPEMPLPDKTFSLPTGLSVTKPSPSDPIPLPPSVDAPAASPKEAIASPTDLEKQVPQKKPWFSRRKEHSPQTATAHSKSPVKLFREIVFSSWANLLLVFVPVGIAMHFVPVNPTVVFVMNFLAIVPLAGVFSTLIFMTDEQLLSFATEEISIKVGETLGGLLNATFGISSKNVI